MCYNKQMKLWRASRMVSRQNYYAGSFGTEKEAAKAIDDLIRSNSLWHVELNFPTEVRIFFGGGKRSL